MTITSNSNPIFVFVGVTKYDISPYIDNLGYCHGKVEGNDVLARHMSVEGFFPEILYSFFEQFGNTELEDLQLHYGEEGEYVKALHIDQLMGLVAPVK